MDKLKEILLKAGASLVGYADLGEVASEARAGMPMGICLAAALDRDVLDDALEGPTPAVRADYDRTNAILVELHRRAGSFLQDKGFRAARIDEVPGNYDAGKLTARLTHKMVATRAGLGWIGNSGLLVTKDFGPAVRLGSILTDAELTPDEPVNDSKCGNCRICSESCPAGAIVGNRWKLGRPREQLLEAFACRKAAVGFAERLGLKHPTCGVCVAVCPWTRRYVEGTSGNSAPMPGRE